MFCGFACDVYLSVLYFLQAQQQFPTYDPTYQAYEQYDQTYEQAAT